MQSMQIQPVHVLGEGSTKAQALPHTYAWVGLVMYSSLGILTCLDNL